MIDSSSSPISNFSRFFRADTGWNAAKISVQSSPACVKMTEPPARI
jgi:hypothetical protein